MGVGQSIGWLRHRCHCGHRMRTRQGRTHLLLPTFIASALHGLSSLIIARIVIVHILYTPRRAVHARNDHIAFATLHAVGSGRGDRCMIDSRHYGTDGDRSIIVLHVWC